MDADRNTGANPSRESPLAGTGDSEAVEDPDSQDRAINSSRGLLRTAVEKTEATRICLLSLAYQGP